jgi:hypothetical protein
MKATMKIGDLVECTWSRHMEGNFERMIGIIVSRHKEAYDPLYFVLIDGNEFPFRQDQLEVIA